MFQGTNMPATKMVNINIEETSGVDHPAHLQEGWIILKQADRAGVAAAIAALAKEEQPMADQDTTTETIEATETVEDTTAADLAKANERIAELEAQIAALTVDKSEDAASEDAILKSAPEAVRDMIVKAREDAAAAREELRKEREAQADREYVAKAKGWANLAIDAEAFGPMLRRLFDLDPAIGEVVEKALSAADAQAESGAIFTELGKSAPAPEADAFSRVQSLAKAAVERGEYSTVEQAVAGLVVANPDLYTEYLAQRG